MRDIAASDINQHTIHVRGQDHLQPAPASGTATQVAGTSEAPSHEQIVARLTRERPARSGQRRVRWTVAQLELVNSLAADEGQALARLAAENHDDHDEAIAALDEISATARRLIAARRAPASQPDAETADGAQVAYLMPVEVVVDLEQQRVCRVVAIDEAVELDGEEGARAQSTLTPLTPSQAETAVAVAELTDGGEWPAVEFGF